MDIFDKCFERFKDTLEVEKITELSEQMEKFIERYN